MPPAGGWFTTKKRGRDDDEIASDRAVAIEKLKQSRGRGGGLVNNNKKKAPPQNNRKGKKARKRCNDSDSSDEDDDDNSLDEFIVHSDNSDEDEWDVENEEESDEEDSLGEYDDDDDDDVEIIKQPKQRRIENERVAVENNDSKGKSKAPDLSRFAYRPATSTAARAVTNDNDSDESSVSEGDSFLQNRHYKKRTSRPPLPVDKKLAAAESRRKRIDGSSNNSKKLAVMSSSDDDDADLFQSTPAASKQKSALNGFLSNDSDTDCLPSSSKLTRKPRPNNNYSNDNLCHSKPTLSPLRRNDEDNDSTAKISKFFSKNTQTTPTAYNNNNNRQETISLLLGSSEDESDNDNGNASPLLSATSSGRPQKNKKRIMEDDDESDGSMGGSEPHWKSALSPAKNIPKVSSSSSSSNNSKHGNSNYNDGFSDDDEAMAMALALSESQKDAAVDASKKEEEETDQKVIDLLQEDDEDDENDENEDVGQEEYILDEDARTAGTVLATANSLSAKVLQTMMSWSGGLAACATGPNSDDVDDGSNDDRKTAPSSVPVGMIVDGALAFSTIMNSNDDQDNDGAKASPSSFISEAVMKTACPLVKLANYQLIGVNWLALLHGMTCDVEGGSSLSSTNVNGILADEMGLGKTVQTIAFLAWLKKCYYNDKEEKGGNSQLDEDEEVLLVDSDDDDDNGKPSPYPKAQKPQSQPHLVVAPASVLSNWEREFTKFAPHLKVVKYHGNLAERTELQHELQIHLPKYAERRKRMGRSYVPVDVILCSITYFSKESAADRSFLRKFSYDYLIVDEAHVLKNPKGRTYKTLDSFSSQHRLLLTGTPVQNSPQELMALLCFLMPLFSRKGGGFDDDDNDSNNDGGLSMLQHFVSLQGKDKNGKDKSKDRSLNSEAEAYHKLKQLFAPFVLRRRKIDVLSQIMPPKLRKDVFVELDQTARTLYDSILKDHIQNKTKGKSNGLSSALRNHLFTQLRKAAHHPLLLRSRYRTKSEKEHLVRWFYQYNAFHGEACTEAKVAEEMEQFNDFDIHLTALELIENNPLRRAELGRYVLDEQDLFCSAKFVHLRSLLPELVSAGHRILIFSGWTNCLDLLSCLMESLGLSYLRMEGSTPVPERQDLIDKYNEDTSIPVFLLSTRACGLGINLTAADTCIMHDLDFNPFNDVQAEDRCHRIGQTKPVTVYKLISRNTVDEDIYEMQERKAKMNAAIMDNHSSSSSTVDNMKKGKDEVLQTAVNRFLRSPTATAASTVVDEKENLVRKMNIYARDDV